MPFWWIAADDAFLFALPEVADSLIKVVRLLFFVPLTAAIIALTFLAMGLEMPLFIASAVQAFAGQLESNGAHPGRVILEGGGGCGKGALSSASTPPPPPPEARFPWL